MRKVRYAVALVGDVGEDCGRIVPLGDDGGECALFLHAGRYHAVGSLCPHQNAPLSGARVAAGVVTCPRHGYRFDLTTGECVTVGGYGIPVYEVTLEGEVLYVNVWEVD
jgi:nitrite reductase/ring-hydroxylating ferredoxin subunit